MSAQQKVYTLFVKDSNAKFITIIQQYKDWTQNIIWYNVRNRRVYFGKSADIERVGEDCMSNSYSMSLSVVEFIKFLNVMDKVNKNDDNLYHVLYEDQTYEKEDRRLVIKKVGVGEKDTLCLCLLREIAKKISREEELKRKIEDNSDPIDSDEEEEIPVMKKTYEDSFEKFFVGGKDNWDKMRKKIRAFYHKLTSHKLLEDEEIEEYEGVDFAEINQYGMTSSKPIELNEAPEKNRNCVGITEPIRISPRKQPPN